MDPALHKASVARRALYHYPVIPPTYQDDTVTGESGSGSKKKSGSSLTARVLQELREDGLQSLKDGALSKGGDRNGTTNGGQIVLHREVDIRASQSGASSHVSAGGVLALPGQTVQTTSSSSAKPSGNSNGEILVKKSTKFTNISIPTPQWHAPWQLSTVLSSHLGWVRSIAFDPTNDMFATGSADRTIKLFDFAKACVGASDALKITLTGHIGPIRGMAFSPRHPLPLLRGRG